MLSCTIPYRNKAPFFSLVILLYIFLHSTGTTAQDAITGRVYTIHTHRNTTSGQPGVKILLLADHKTVDSCFTDSHGNYCFLAEGHCNDLRVKPSPEGLPLPQPDGWDAVLIMRHILGIQPFTDRSQFVRADINKSGSITTFDILNVRQRVFGLEKKAETPVWRFYDAALPENFQDGVTADYRVVNEKMMPATHIDFVACPPGKMDGTSEEEQNPINITSVLRLEGPQNPADDLQQFSVYYDGPAPALALQFALQFDPEAMTLVGPAPVLEGGFSAANFDLSKASTGHIGLVWQATDEAQIPLDSGSLLFHLIFTTNTKRSAQQLEISRQSAPIAAAWTPAGQKMLVMPAFTTGSSFPENGIQSPGIRREKAGDPLTLHLNSDRPGKARVVILAAFGERLSLRDIPVESGYQELFLPETDTLKTGVYHWWLKMPNGEIHTGLFVKR